MMAMWEGAHEAGLLPLASPNPLPPLSVDAELELWEGSTHPLHKYLPAYFTAS
jgi:hypothetical protein